MAPTFHLRRSLSEHHLTHYIHNRTLRALCGHQAIEWPLVLEGSSVATCEKCRKMLDKLKAQEGLLP